MYRQMLIVLGALLLVGCAVGPNQLGISSQQWQGMDQAQKKKLIENYHQVNSKKAYARAIVYKGPTIVANLSGGTAMMPPFVQAYPYQPVSFRMKPGQCRGVTLTSTDSTHSVNLEACYNGLVLSLDPSSYETDKSLGSLRVNYNPIWGRGFTYSSLSSAGYVRLSNVNLTVKAVSNGASF